MKPSKTETLFVIPKTDDRKTFDQDDKLPSLPVPDLDSTLDRYLNSLKPFVLGEEYERASELVEAFRTGIGRTLHEKLLRKARNERNWVEKWWEDVAYLQERNPLILSCNMVGALPKNAVPWTYGTEDDQIKHAATFAYHLTEFWRIIRNEELLPTQTADKKTYLSMSQYRKLFNTTRTPGEKKDSVVSYFQTVREGPCPTTVTIICKGRLFSVDAVDSAGNPVPLSAWENAIRQIVNICREETNTCPIGLFTCDNRSNWSKNRMRLIEMSARNSEALNVIERSMFVIALDEDSPETDSDVVNANICGNHRNRWADKSMTIVFYKNGRNGSLCDHTAFDGIAAIACLHYAATATEESAEGKKNEIDKTVTARFQELEFDVDEVLMAEAKRLEIETSKYVSTTDNTKNSAYIVKEVFDDYGKLEIQSMKFHPDSFVQMCLQLAYVTLHGKPAPCYETATTRKFYNGRTETVRSATTECLEWVAAMLDNKCSNEERKKLLERAVKRHDELMSEARENRGCDRHLFGLYCIAVEEGLEIPKLFTDSSYLKSGGGGNFVLSTSCTGYTPLGGGVLPMCVDGYGVFYNLLPYGIHFTLSVNKKSKETNVGKYFESLKNSFRRTREMLLGASKTSKL